MVKLFNFRERDIDLRLMRFFVLGDHLRQTVKRLRTKNDINVWRTGEDLFTLLACHTATHGNHHIILTGFFFGFTYASQVGKDFFLSLFPNGAGIKHHEIGLVYILGSFVAVFG